MVDFLSEIIGRIKTELQNQAEAVTAGTNINTFDDYKQHIGVIQGLELSLAIIDEILTENDEEDL